jgi:hypothetical protein
MNGMNFVNQKVSIFQEQVASRVHPNAVKIPKFKRSGVFILDFKSGWKKSLRLLNLNYSPTKTVE